ncbi:MAG TPA: RDD family protein [Mycobacteriales bacterium]
MGLPESGQGSMATAAARLGAFCVDAVLSALVAGLFTAPELPRNWSLVVLVASYVVFTSFFGQTPGMRIFALRMVRVDRPAPVGVLRALTRTVLLVLLVPALIWDADGRGLHDRVASTVIVRG